MHVCVWHLLSTYIYDISIHAPCCASRGKGGGVGVERSRIVMKLSSAEQAQCESPGNLNKIADIESAWPTGGQPLQRPGRLFICESLMHKMCRKGLKARYFWLCNDILVPSSIFCVMSLHWMMFAIQLIFHISMLNCLLQPF